MKLTLRDGIATLALAAMVVPYVGYLVRGEMPLIQDLRELAVTALVLGVAVLLTAGRVSTARTLGRVEVGLGRATLTLGVVTVAVAETAAAEVLLAAFVAAIVVVWGVEMLHHAGAIHPRSAPRPLSRR